MAVRALLVDVDYDDDGRRGDVARVLDGSTVVPTLALGEAAAAQLLLAAGPPRPGRHALVVDAGPLEGDLLEGDRPDRVPPGRVLAIVELDDRLEPRVLRRTDPPGSPSPTADTEPIAPPWLPAGPRVGSPDEPVRYGRRRHGYGLLLTAGLLGALAALGMLAGADDGFLWPPLARIVAGAGAVVALTCTAIALRHLVARRPALELDADGLVDRTRMAPTRRLAWTDVSAVTVSRPDRRRFRRLAARLPDTTYLVLQRRAGRAAVVALGPVAAAPRALVAQVAVHWEAHRGPVDGGVAPEPA